MQEETVQVSDCLYSKGGRHYFVNTVGQGVKADFVPVEFGKSANDTVYKRIEYSMMGCNCGVVRKAEVIA